jgi:hypothetical protein
MSHPDEQMRTAYAAAVQALAAMGVRNLFAVESTDPEVQGVVVRVDSDGAVDVSLLGHQGQPVGGYSL